MGAITKDAVDLMHPAEVTVEATVGVTVGATVEVTVGGKIGATVGGKVKVTVGAAVGGKMGAAVGGKMGATVGGKTGAKVEVTVGAISGVGVVSVKLEGQIRLTTRPLRAWTGRLVDPEGDATVAFSQVVEFLNPRMYWVRRLYWETEIDTGVSTRFHQTTSEQGGVVRPPS